MAQLHIFGRIAIAGLIGAGPVLAQCSPQFNISVYSDATVSQDLSMVYGYGNAVDSSTLCSCSHSSYQVTETLQGPSGYQVSTGSTTAHTAMPTNHLYGTYYASGSGTLYCSCIGTIGYGGGSDPIYVPPPPPVITGVADSSTWANTIYVGASGYLAVFGSALTAWGETPSPTVSGDDSNISLALSYPSDGQVNVSYTVRSGARTGQHSLWITTAAGTSNAGTYQVAYPRITVTRPNLTQASATGTPQGGTFSWAATSYANVGFAAGVNQQTNPNGAVLSNAPNPSPTGAPSPGALATVSGWYTLPAGPPVSGTFHVPTFGMSCYYTASQQDWGTAPSSCGTTTIYGVLYSGAWTNPPGLSAGSYCNAFLAQVSLQGSGVLSTGTAIGYAGGGYPPSSSYRVISSINGADGSPVQAGRTVARDRSIIPVGVYVDINKIGNGLLANDTGGAISGYRIDYYNGAGRSACAGFNNIMGVSGCNPGNANCPSDTAIQ